MFQLERYQEHMMYTLHSSHKCSMEDTDQQIDSQCSLRFDLMFCLCMHQHKQLQDHQLSL